MLNSRKETGSLWSIRCELKQLGVEGSRGSVKRCWPRAGSRFRGEHDATHADISADGNRESTDG
jgi:hypothetical protein